MDKWIPGITAALTRQWRSNQVSGRSLLETGIFSKTAGDFRRFGPAKKAKWESRDWRPNAKAAVGGPFWHLSGDRHKGGTAWLAMQCCSRQSPAKFPANREFYREFREF